MPTMRTKRLLLSTAALLTLAALALGFYDLSAIRASGFSRHEQATLGLRAEQSDKGLKVAWNPQAPVLAAAKKGELLIEDGPHKTLLLLAPDQIRKGSLQYLPYTGTISMRLSAFDRNHRSSIESLQVIQSASSQIADPANADVAADLKSETPDVGATPEPREPASGTADRLKHSAFPAVPNTRYLADVPGTVVVHGVVMRGTPVDIRIPVDSHGRPLELGGTETATKPSGIVHHLSAVGKAPLKLWPFHHRRHVAE